jgi:hypothetical protein
MNNIVNVGRSLGIDLEKANTASKENPGKSITIEFDGFIQLVDAGQEYDLKFKTPTSSFKKIS